MKLKHKILMIFVSAALLLGVLSLTAGAVYADGDGQAQFRYVAHPYTVSLWSDSQRHAMTYVETVRNVGAFGEPGFTRTWEESGSGFGNFEYSMSHNKLMLSLITEQVPESAVPVDGYLSIEFHDFSYITSEPPTLDSSIVLFDGVASGPIELVMSYYASDVLGNTSYHELTSSSYEILYLEEYSINTFVSDVMANENLYAIYVESLAFHVPIETTLWGSEGSEPFYVYSDLSYTSTDTSNVGDFLTFIEGARENVAEVDDFTISEFLVSAVGGFFDATLFGAITFGDIFLVLIGIVLVVLFLKFFAGG